MMKGIQKIISGILVFCLLLPMLSVQVVAAEETVASTEEIMDVTHTIAEDAEKTVIASDEPERKVASDFTYSYDEKRHKLTISGNGDMPSWEAYEDAPWYSLDYALVEIGEGLTSIGSYAFAYDYAGLGEFTTPYFIIPESVTQIGSNAFFGNAAKLRFRGDAPEFHAAAFDKAVQISVFYPENNETWTTDIQQNYGADMADWNCAYTSGTYACGAKWSYDDSTGVLTLSGEEMPELFPMLPDWNVFFSGTISSVQIEDGVPEIMEGAFKDCYNLRTISVPDSVTVIGADAFRKCYNLEELELPDSVTEIANAFYRCDNLEKIKFTGNAPAFDENTFINITLTVYYPAGNITWTEAVTQDYGGNITWVPYGEEHVHEYDATHKCECGAIGGTCGEDLIWEFDEATGTITVSGVGAMDNYYSSTDQAWYNYRDQIKNVVIESGVTTIGVNAFRECNNLSNVTIPDGVTSIEIAAFYKCTNLTSVSIPNTVTTIESGAFEACTRLIKISIPANIQIIGVHAFRGCTSLTGIWVDKNNSSYSSDNRGVLYNKNKTVLLQAPGALAGPYEILDGVTAISWFAFYGCGSLTNVIIPNSVSTIDHHAFEKCTSLTIIIVPDNVASLGEWAFRDCSDLQAIYFRSDAPSFGNNVFYETAATAYYPANNSTWTSDVMQNYGGDITWKSYCPDGHSYDNDQDMTCNACGHVRELEGAEADTTPMFRLYNPYTQEHLLTADAAERDLLVSAGWSLDGVAWDSPNAGDHVYRLYNPYDDWHTYSMNQEEIDMLVPLGWKVDGAVCRSATKAEGKPVYRLFNPYEQKNYHLLTASEEERAFLMDLGWTLDGVAWYCLAD